MRKAGEHGEENRFYALEMRANRVRMRMPHQPVDKVLSLAYDIVSAYGTSVARGIISFLVWNVGFALLLALLLASGPAMQALGIPLGWNLYLGISATPAPITATGSIFHNAEAIGLAVQNALNPFALVVTNSVVKVHNASVFALSIVQSIGSISILTLLLLAIRNRFQRSGQSP